MFFRPKSHHPLQKTARGARFARPPAPVFAARIAFLAQNQNETQKMVQVVLYMHVYGFLGVLKPNPLPVWPNNGQKPPKQQKTKKNHPKTQYAPQTQARGRAKRAPARLFAAGGAFWGVFFFVFLYFWLFLAVVWPNGRRIRPQDP